ncbi:basic leucine zipper transcriptional factor ATF-like [Gadus chalcogrammus]|uniref:basic leucine zipper transcriptional factor ATF-like n=1 Tax=Gadus chalcogrammus TaxID=1042646 RepID=UPI0024C48A90|nr:basic leucine zipper transcriptional factor ATF-like [Gadus chalcogrammus]
MAHGSDSNDTSYNRSPSPASQPGSSDDAKRVMRREKNRIAAQKSRMRQTQKADTLHLVRITASRDRRPGGRSDLVPF